MLTLQEVKLTGTYHLDSRGAERRWLPPTLPNCENSLSWKHYIIYSIKVRMCHMSLVMTPSPSRSLSLFAAHVFSQCALSSLYSIHSLSDKTGYIDM